MDLAVATRFNVDPYVVDHVWPEGLRQRAVEYMVAEAKHEKKRGKGEDHIGRNAARLGGRRAR